jgi:alpha-aminoadipic semialdehyde synthase
VQPSIKRIHHDSQYEDVGCQISDDLSECGLILAVKQPKVLTPILSHGNAINLLLFIYCLFVCLAPSWRLFFLIELMPFFSHTHKAQKENMPLLDKVVSPILLLLHLILLWIDEEYLFDLIASIDYLYMLLLCRY